MAAPKPPAAPTGLAPYIDHSLLKPDVTQEQIRQLCTEAREHSFAAVCVNPCHVPLCIEALKGAAPKVCTVIGFPLGANATALKIEEARLAIEAGATELDMVLNLGWLKSGEYQRALEDIQSVRCAAPGALLKVIIEACLLTDEEKRIACLLSVAAGADFVKTSTGFSSSGATEDDVRLMRAIVGENIGVKAAGGIRDANTALAMIKAGANRIGCSCGMQIIKTEKFEPI
ncbi:deoxyribose-phosphate aldolase [Candidatus Sumerlaeota bacterium]|nr:deoxyribose-phosphate aldolase [Candidatus Sumerlaeota bacterium]